MCRSRRNRKRRGLPRGPAPRRRGLSPDEKCFIVEHWIEHPSDAVRVRKERRLGTPVGGTEESPEPRVAVIPANDHLERPERRAGALPNSGLHAQRDARTRKVERRDRLADCHCAAGRNADAFVVGENLAQQQTALLVLRTAQVPQDLLADVVRQDHQQATPGWQTGRQRGRTPAERRHRLQWQVCRLFSPAHQVRAWNCAPHDGQRTSPLRPRGRRRLRPHCGQGRPSALRARPQRTGPSERPLDVPGAPARTSSPPRDSRVRPCSRAADRK